MAEMIDKLMDQAIKDQAAGKPFTVTYRELSTDHQHKVCAAFCAHLQFKGGPHSIGDVDTALGESNVRVILSPDGKGGYGFSIHPLDHSKCIEELNKRYK